MGKLKYTKKLQTSIRYLQVTRREIFQVLREKYGNGFGDFIQEKVCPLAGDVICEDFGLDTAKLKELSKNMDIIVNGAATTNFYERLITTNL